METSDPLSLLSSSREGMTAVKRMSEENDEHKTQISTTGLTKRKWTKRDSQTAREALESRERQTRQKLKESQQGEQAEQKQTNAHFLCLTTRYAIIGSAPMYEHLRHQWAARVELFQGSGGNKNAWKRGKE